MFTRSAVRCALNPNVLSMQHSGIRVIMEAAWGLEKKGTKVRHLEVGQPNFKTPDAIVNACTDAMRQEGNQRYCPNLGIGELREAAAEYFTKRGNQTIPPSRIAATPGCVFSMAVSMLAVVAPGQKVLLPNPGWPNYEMASQATGVVPIFYTLNPANGWLPDFDEIAQLLKEHSDIKMLVLCNPSNPTGQVFSTAVLDELLRLCEEADTHVLSDEIYGDITFGGDAPSILGSQYYSPERHIVISGVSKTYSMTGFRVGFLTASDEVIDQVSKLGEAFISCGAPFAQAAAAAALGGCANDEVDQMLASYASRRSIIVETLTAHNLLEHLTGGPPGGSLYCLLHVGHVLSLFDNDVTNFTLALLQQKGIATSPGSCFGSAARNHIRICFAGVDEATLQSSMEDICLFVKEMEGKLTS